MILDNIKKDRISFPIDIIIRDGLHYIVSAILPRSYFKDPFLLDSLSRYGIAEISKAKPQEQVLLVRPLHYDVNDQRIKFTLLDDFIASFKANDFLEDRLGFIFHMSRCGSTLITQMLASSGRFFVASEPPVITKLIDPAFSLEGKYAKNDVLKALISSIESGKPSNAEFTFIKFRSWNTLFIEDILQCFPNTRWMFVHRNGLEVLESVLRDPPGWLRSRETYVKYFAPSLKDDGDDFIKMSDDEYVARILGAFCRKANRSDTSAAILIDYENIKDSLYNKLASKWGISLTDLEKETMREVSKLYSKDRTKQKIFESDSHEKRVKASQKQKDIIQAFTEVERLKLINIV